MSNFELATLVLQGITIAVVAWGVYAMRRATEQRSKDGQAEMRRLTAADERRHKEAAQHHAESMRALDNQRQALESLIAGQQEQATALREQGAALGEQATALSALVSRTAPGGP